LALPLTASKPQPDTYQAHFQHLGTILEVEAFIHVQIPITVNVPINDSCDSKTVDLLRKFRKHMEPPHSNDVPRFLSAVYDTHRDNCRRMRALNNGLFLPQFNSPAGRDKRAIGLLALAAGTLFGSLVSTWVANQAVNHQLDMHEQTIIALTDNARSMAKHLAMINGVMENNKANVHSLAAISTFQELTHRQARTLDQIEDLLTAAHNEKLTLGLVTPNDLVEILNKATTIAAQHELTMPIVNPMHLLELPASFQRSEGMVNISIFVPLISQKYDVHRLLPSPVFVSDNASDPTLLAIMSPHQLIAEHQTMAAHAPLTKEDFDNCLQLGSYFLCTDMVKLPNTADSCIGALFSANAAASAKLCAFHNFNSDWHIVHGGNSTFFVTSLHPINSITTCRRRGYETTRTEAIIPAGVSSFHLPDGCTKLCRKFTVRGAHTSVAGIIVDKTINWDIKEDLLHGNTLASLRTAVQSIKDHGGTPPEDIEDILNQALNIPDITPVSLTRVTVSSIMGNVLLSITIFLLLFCCGRRYGRQVKRRATRQINNVQSNVADLTMRSDAQALETRRLAQRSGRAHQRHVSYDTATIHRSRPIVTNLTETRYSNLVTPPTGTNRTPSPPPPPPETPPAVAPLLRH